MKGTLFWTNLTLRGLMEFGIIVALGYWGFYTGSTVFTKILLGLGTPLLVFGFWSLVDFHQAGPFAEPLRLFEELIISGLAAVALYLSGQPGLSLALVAISIIHHGLVYSMGDSILKT